MCRLCKPKCEHCGEVLVEDKVPDFDKPWRVYFCRQKGRWAASHWTCPKVLAQKGVQ